MEGYVSGRRNSPRHLLKTKEEPEGETIDVSMSCLLVRAPRTAPVGSSLAIACSPLIV